jgi:carboxyl-terminal processing protease
VKILGRIFVFISVTFFLLTLASWGFSAIGHRKESDTDKEFGLFADALAIVQGQYVDEKKPKDLIYGALSGLLDSLDPHSQFLTPQEYEDLKQDTEGKFGGVGIEITIKDNLVTIITPIEGTPAWDAGLLSNDRIVKIDGVVIKNFTLNEMVKKLRGAPGTEVHIVVWRERDGKLHEFKIKRQMIDIKDIKEVKVVSEHVGYLRLVEFRENTPAELDRALEVLKGKGAESLILDLRNNPGGLLDQAIEVAERFLPRGSLVVSVNGRDEKQNTEYKSEFKSPDLNIPIVVLINEGSASGSEIVAGALQDHKRALLLGTRTFGKGSVQTVFPLSDGSALKLTTSRYFTPSGRSIHEKGIMPDIIVENKVLVEKKKDDKEKLEEIFEGVEEKKPESKEALSSKIDETDAPLSRALDLLKGWGVYKNTVKASQKE